MDEAANSATSRSVSPVSAKALSPALAASPSRKKLTELPCIAKATLPNVVSSGSVSPAASASWTKFPVNVTSRLTLSSFTV